MTYCVRAARAALGPATPAAPSLDGSGLLVSPGCPCGRSRSRKPAARSAAGVPPSMRTGVQRLVTADRDISCSTASAISSTHGAGTVLHNGCPPRRNCAYRGGVLRSQRDRCTHRAGRRWRPDATNPEALRGAPADGRYAHPDRRLADEMVCAIPPPPSVLPCR